MKAALLTGLHRVEVRDVPDPRLKNATDVLIRIGTVGLCGSDVHYYKEGGIGDQVVEYPFIAGHECAGTVAETASSVRKLKPGDRVAVDPAVVCGGCDQCLAGRPNTCRRLLYLGTPGQIFGALCEFIVMPEQNCHSLPDSLALEEGVLVEPLSIALHGIRMAAEPVPESIVVLGAGPIGLSIILAARAAGVRTVYATDKLDERVRTALKSGAAWAGNPDHEDIVAAIGRLSPGQVDAVFECCGDQAALDQAVALLKPGGRLLIVGIPAVRRVSFDIHSLRRKEISLHNVRRQRGCIQDAIDLIVSKKADVRFMATHSFRIEDAQKAFELAAGYSDGVIRAIIRP
ncbi:MAG: alcohol dehydrogenase catalytic domain-containing protein [Candidatus Aminicenantales bacterium]